MKKSLQNILIVLLLFPLMAAASEQANIVVVSGQIINYKYGNPVKNHSVFIVPEDNTGDPNRNVIELKTDDDGFYYDSIATLKLKGAYTIYTYDYSGRRIDTTLHFRFLVFNSNVLVANFKIYMPYQMQLLQTRFKYYQKQGGNRFSFLFFDLTSTNNIISRHWDFGDGDTSNIKKPVHKFKKSGFYKVSLTVTAIINAQLQSNTSIRMIYIPNRSYYNFGGHAFCQYFPIDYAVAFLYMLDSSRTFIPVDTAYVDTLGYYYFYQVPKADYLVKVQPTTASSVYGQMLPTYYGDKLLWENATIIKLNQTGWEYDIHLQKDEGLKLGNGFLHGNISFFNELKESNDKPAEGIPVYLLDDDSILLTYHYSDSLGNFDFNNIPFGAYTLMPEITGVHCNDLNVVISNIHPDVDSIQIVIIDNEGSLTVPQNQLYNNKNIIGNPYPLPAHSTIYIAIQRNHNDLFSWYIFNVAGNIIENGSFALHTGNNIFDLNVSSLQNGFYFIRFISQNGEIVQKKFVISK